MIAFKFKRHVFLVSFLLSHSSPLFINTSWGMIKNEEDVPFSIKHNSTNHQSQTKLCLMDGLEAFEQSNFELAAKILADLHKKGALTPYAYLEYMQKNNHAKIILSQDSPFFEPVPDAGIKLSQEFLNASLAYIGFQKKKTKPNLQKLATLVLNSNPHALSLMKKLCKDDKKTFDLLKTCNNFKKLKSIDDLQLEFSPKWNAAIPYWNCLDKDMMHTYYKSTSVSAWKQAAFQFEVQSNQGKNTGEIALNLHTLYPTQQFWAHLAVENGMEEACGILGRMYHSFLQEDKEKNLNYKENDVIFSRYYLSILLENHLYIKKYAGFIACQADMYRRENPTKARLYYKKAAPFVLQARYNYGQMVLHGEGGKKNTKKGMEQWDMCARDGLKRAQTVCANAYYNGNKGTEKDLKKARFYYGLAVKNEDAYSKFCNFSYGQMCYFGEGGDINLSEACTFIKRAADAGLREAQAFYAGMCRRGETLETDFYLQMCEATKYYKLAANQGDIESIMMLHAAEELENKKISDLKIQDAEKGSEESNPDRDVVIQLSSPESKDDSSDEEKQTITTTVAQTNVLENPEKAFFLEENEKTELMVEKSNPPLEQFQNPILHENKEKREDEVLEKKLRKELDKYAQKNAIEHQELGEKKRAQKAAAALTLLTLTVKRKDFDQTCTSIKPEIISTIIKKSDVCYDTLALVKTIFGQGDTKINTFSNLSAQQAFANLGCIVKNKKKENSTLVSFHLGGERVMKLKYHNPHGHGDENLYDALKPYLKRFLQSINKTPETLQVK